MGKIKKTKIKKLNELMLSNRYYQLLAFSQGREYRFQIVNLGHQLAEKEQQVRHQVCEEIRLNSKQDINRGLYTISYADLYRIEKKGEKK